MTDNSSFIMAQFSKSDSVLLSRHLTLDLSVRKEED